MALEIKRVSHANISVLRWKVQRHEPGSNGHVKNIRLASSFLFTAFLVSHVTLSSSGSSEFAHPRLFVQSFGRVCPHISFCCLSLPTAVCSRGHALAAWGVLAPTDPGGGVRCTATVSSTRRLSLRAKTDAKCKMSCRWKLSHYINYPFLFLLLLLLLLILLFWYYHFFTSIALLLLLLLFLLSLFL